MNRRILIPVVLATALLSGCRISPNWEEQNPSIKVAESKPLPSFSLNDVLGRGEVSSDRFKGKVLIVDVWATWCEPCKKEMPWFQALADKYGNRGVEVVGISIDPSPSEAAKFANELGVHYTLL